jgi:hypothetical protein
MDEKKSDFEKSSHSELPDEQYKRCDFAQLKAGDRLSETQYYEVTDVTDEGISVRNARGYSLDIAKSVVEEGMYSASQFEEERRISRTELSEILEQAGDTAFTVNFNKQIKERDALNEIQAAFNEIPNKSSDEIQDLLKIAARRAIKGEERTLLGYLLRSEPKMGRSQVVDLEVPPGRNRIRLVDHRTLNWLILKKIKYIAKK